MTKDKAILELNKLLAQNYDQRDQLRREAEDVERLLDENTKQRAHIIELINQIEY